MNSAAHPASPGTQSQNTAPVIKYQCLFTHDLRRKAKRWQDGYLQFHTFNKRIMVYDLSANFIGDQHWRNGEELCDGDELQLERRGVLVQVGECVQRSQADLTGLLDKRKTAAGSSPMRAFSPENRPGVSRTQDPGGTQRLKSLNELLGIKRTPIGRALPIKSPYEIRNELIHNDRPEIQGRPPKRQRILPGQDGRDIDPGQRGHAQSPKSLEVKISKSQHSSGTDVRRQVNQVPAAQPKHAENGTGLEAERTSSTVQKPGPPAPRPLSEDPVNTLRIAVEKPRKRLMYRSLLPNAAQKPATALSKSTRPTATEKATVYRDKSAAADNDDGLPHGSSLSRNDNGFKSAALVPTDPNALRFVPSSSTMRALEESIPPPSSQNYKTIDTFFKPSGQKSPRKKERLHPEDGKDPSKSPVKSIQRTLARSHSDTSSLHRNPAEPPRLAQDDSTLPQPQNSTAPAQTSPAKSFQKSVSDTSALRARPNVKHQVLLATSRDTFIEAASPDTEEEEQGPWTAEALDLFDWWPAGRPKPNSVPV